MSQAIEALRPRTMTPAGETARPDHHVIDIDPPGADANIAPPAATDLRRRAPLHRDAARGAMRPDHHAIDIDPPAPQAEPPRAGAIAAPPVVPAWRRPATLRALSHVQATVSAVASAGFLAHRHLPGYGLDKAALGLALANVPLTWAIVHGQLQAIRAEAEGLRHPELRGQALDQVVKGFCAPDSAAARFDWNASGLFVNTMGMDMADEVSHILARAFAAARTPAGSAIAPELRVYADNLASSATLRAALAQTAYEANVACDDRVGVRLGELMLAGIMHMARDTTTEPRTVVGTLVLHAATRAMEQRISALLAQGRSPETAAPQPSAELMLAGCHAVQAALVRRGLAVPELFPEHLFGMDDLHVHRNAVMATAEAIAEACHPSRAPGQPAGHAIVRFLERHGGEAAQAVLSARLAHLAKPLQATAQRELATLDATLETLSDQQYRDDADKVKQDYDTAVAQMRAHAIDGALAGDDADWVIPDAPAPTSEPEPAQSHGETSADAGAAPVPDGYDPTRGKWKTG
ncbi:type III effector protein [Ralstonia pseudosolanacearum]|nr:type III effector protein [Ralstonia pseudosolanacearum]